MLTLKVGFTSTETFWDEEANILLYVISEYICEGDGVVDRSPQFACHDME